MPSVSMEQMQQVAQLMKKGIQTHDEDFKKSVNYVSSDNFQNVPVTQTQTVGQWNGIVPEPSSQPTPDPNYVPMNTLSTEKRIQSMLTFLQMICSHQSKMMKYIDVGPVVKELALALGIPSESIISSASNNAPAYPPHVYYDKPKTSGVITVASNPSGKDHYKVHAKLHDDPNELAWSKQSGYGSGSTGENVKDLTDLTSTYKWGSKSKDAEATKVNIEKEMAKAWAKAAQASSTVQESDEVKF